MSFTSWPRDFVVAVAARSFSLFGDLVTLTTLALLVQSRGESPAVLAALFAAGLLPVVLLAPLTGRLVDSRDSRVLLVGAGAGAAAAGVGIALVPSTPWLLALTAVTGALTGVLASTWSALVPVVVGAERIAAASGVNQTLGAVAMLAAPATAGVLVGATGYHLPLLLDAATYAAIALAGLAIGTRRRPDRAAGPARAREGWATLWAEPVMRAAVVLLASFVLLANIINVTDIYLIRDTLSLSPAWFGGFAAAWGGGAVLGGASAARRPGARSQARMLAAGCGLVCLAAGALAAARGASWLVPIALVGGFGNGWSNAGASALFMLRSPDALRGRVSAAIGAVLSGAQLGAYALGAVVAGLLPPRGALVVVAVGGTLVVLVTGRMLLHAVRPDGSRRRLEPRRERVEGVRPAEEIGDQLCRVRAAAGC